MSKGRRKLPTTVRFDVLSRGGYKCHYCGATGKESELTIDHITPLDQGGSDDPSNLVAACETCNRGKSDRPVGPEVAVEVAAATRASGRRLAAAFRGKAAASSTHLTHLSSVERYRDRIWSLVEEVERGPRLVDFPGDPRLAFTAYRLRLDLLGAISKAALADKGLENLDSIQKRLREAESLVAEMMKGTANERHNRANRLAVGRIVGVGVTGEPLH